MSGPGDDFNDSPDRGATPPHPAVQHATYRGITHGMLAARGLTPSAACQVGCAICGVIDASPARCEQCTPPLGRPFTGAAPGMLQDDDRGLYRWLANTPDAMQCARDAAAVISTHRAAARYDHQAAGVCPEANSVRPHTDGWCGLCPAGNRDTCRFGPDGCADSACPGRSA
jgi:hypothetical protein